MDGAHMRTNEGAKLQEELRPTDYSCDSFVYVTKAKGDG
jgi:hypothetical protein